MKKKNKHRLRDYGLGDPHESGTVKNPRVIEQVKDAPACPNCGCKSMYAIEVDVENRLLKGNKGIGRYIGCPACPFASPMMMIATSSAAAE